LLADFGVALPAPTEPPTPTGNTVGTAFYMAPEQVRGERVGSAADVYALGLVLLECLTGHREYEGRPIDAAVARLTRPPVLPVDLPVEWRVLLESMVSLDPAHRPSADTVARRCALLAAEADAPDVQPAGFLNSLFPGSDAEDALATPNRSPRKMTAKRARHRTPRGRGRRRRAVVVAAAAAMTVVAATLGVLGPGSMPNPAADSAAKRPGSTVQPGPDAAKDSAADNSAPPMDAGIASAPSPGTPTPVSPQRITPAASTPPQQATAEPLFATSRPPENVVVAAASSATDHATVDQIDAPGTPDKVKNDHSKRGDKDSARKLDGRTGNEGPGKGTGKTKDKH
jgi:eukaryotic-like serine/threonine-protein kinase